MTNPPDDPGRDEPNEEPRTARLRRSYALAAVDALRQYVAGGLRFALRTVGPGERIAPERRSMRVVFTLPDWTAYTSFLRSRFSGERPRDPE